MYIHRVYIWIYNIHIIHKINTRMATYRYMCVVRVCACVWSKVYFRRRIFAGNKKKKNKINIFEKCTPLSLFSIIRLHCSRQYRIYCVPNNNIQRVSEWKKNHWQPSLFYSSFSIIIQFGFFLSFLLFSSFWCVFLFVVMMMFEMRYMFCQCVSV